MGVIYELKRGFEPKGGDASHKWDRNNPDEVANAAKTFKDLKKKGFTFHTVDPKDGGKGAIVQTFHESLGEVIAVPPQAGG